MSIKIYHNPRWSKSRESVKILEKERVSFKIINYLKDGLNEYTINEILDLLKINPISMIRTNEAEFKKLNLSKEQLVNKQYLINIIRKFPKIMQRPIIINGKKAVIGRPPDNIYKIL